MIYPNRKQEKIVKEIVKKMSKRELIEQLAEARERFRKTAYEVDARECERIFAAIRKIDPDFQKGPK